jgi:large conductance mechanosensitive channel
MKGFFNFIKKQGVVGLAVGFILGGAVSKIVASLVNDVINPIIGMGLGSVEGMKGAYVEIGSARLMWGSFVNTTIDFIVVALVVYGIVLLLGLNKEEGKKA